MKIDFLTTGGHRYVREDYFAQVLDRMAALIKARRFASDPQDIAGCKRREEGFLKYVEEYHHARVVADRFNFTEGGKQ